MDKNKQKNAVILFCGVLLVINFFQNQKLKADVESLRDGYNRMEMYVQNGLTDIRTSMQDHNREIKDMLEKGQSLFSQASADVKLQGNQLVVTMRAVPKELRPGEILTARVSAGGQVYEKEVDEHNRAVLVMDATDSLEPSFVLTSPAGIRQESLDVLYTGQLFTCEAQGSWSRDAGEANGRNLFYGWVSPGADRDVLPFEENDIEQAFFILYDTGIVDTLPEGGRSGSGSGGGFGSFYAKQEGGSGNRIVRIPRGESVPARKLAEGSGGENSMADSGISIGYTADLSGYADKMDGKRYEIYFMLTMKDGMRYVTPDLSIGTFSTYDGGGNRGSGTAVLWPVFGTEDAR